VFKETASRRYCKPYWATGLDGRPSPCRVAASFKNQRNIELRGISFERAADFEFETALTWLDQRKEYGEVRLVALGFLGDRLHALCYLETDEGIRVISLRKANARERRTYDQAQAHDR
jgi:hypothetical protein